MAYPANCHISCPVQCSHHSQNLDYQNLCHHCHNNPTPICWKCQEANTTIGTLQARVAVLETELRTVQAEKESADHATRYLLNLNAKSHLNGNKFHTHRKSGSRLIRKICQAEIKKICAYRMCKELLDQIQSLGYACDGKHVPQNKITTVTECITTDLLGVDEPLVQEQFSGHFPSLNPDESDGSALVESRDPEALDSIAPSLVTDSGGLSETSYIFHFADPAQFSQSSGGCDTIVMIVRSVSSIT